jgi:membrane fusion protein (multidrug efflux system)
MSQKVGQSWRGLNVVACGAALILLPGCTQKGKSDRRPAAPSVVVTETRTMDVPLIVSTNATTRASSQVTISARVKGFLKQVLFTEGADVKKDQLLFVIEEDPFEAALAQANAQLAEAEASVKKAEESKAREIAQAQVDLSLAAELLAGVEDQRARLLFSRNAAAKGDLDLAEANLKKSNAQVSADRASLEQAKADFATNILSAKAKRAQADAAVRDAAINLSYCRMTAPIDGRIGEALVKAGNLVGAGGDTSLATIQQLDPMGVDLEVSSRYLPRVTNLVANGFQIRIEVGTDDIRTYTGRVDFIDNTVNRNTSTFLLKAKMPNPSKSLLPGEYARAFATVEDRKGVVVIPEKAVIESQAGATAYVVDPEGKVAVVSVKVEPDTYRGLKVVRAGRTAGQKVVVEGLQLVRPGMPVETEIVPFDSFILPSDAPPTVLTEDSAPAGR